MNVLGIESTCDETACALVRDGKEILAHVIAEQDHTAYGGVFPEMASRGHEAALVATIEKTLGGERPDLIAVAQGPGLIGSIVMGLSAAKALAMAWDLPLIGVNHVEAHLYAAMMTNHVFDAFPALGLVISGGHTFMVRIDAIGKYTVLGTTVDDAVGEAFDKVASMLDLPYPGGPHIERLAREGQATLPFRAGTVKGKPNAFSFSGLKTRVLYSLEEKKEEIAASFQKAVIDDLLRKVKNNLEGCQALFIGGGVACNGAIRAAFETLDVPVYWPEKALCLDNGAMIAGLGYHKYLERGADPLTLKPFPRIRSANYF